MRCKSRCKPVETVESLFETVIVININVALSLLYYLKIPFSKGNMSVANGGCNAAMEFLGHLGNNKGEEKYAFLSTAMAV